MLQAIADYHPSSPRSRATAVSVALGVHALAILAVLSISTLAITVERPSMRLALLSEQRPPVVIPEARLPLPQLRKPEIQVPEPPRIDIIQAVEVVERPAPPPPPTPQAVVSRVPTSTIEPPRFDLAYLNNPAPAYPVLARRTREQGKVMLRVRVDAGGQVTAIEVQRSSGSQRLDEAALAAVRQWRFVPARAGDQAISGTALVPIDFRLES